MRICLVGEFSGNVDEGVRNIAFNLSQELSRTNDVLKLDLKLKSSISLDTWRKVKAFEPQVIHYLPGPTMISFIVTRIMASLSGGARTVISATHPRLPPTPFDRIVSRLKPDLVLVQSARTEQMFKSLGCRTRRVPCGVDMQKFTPVSAEMKTNLREKYGIAKDSFVVLHVGHISRGRNVSLLEKVQESDCQVIIAASTSIKVDKLTYQSIEARGCLIWRRYFEHIEDIYNLSDCYFFPTVSSRGSPELPLSVMEAMACNLPVISTRFGALPEFFQEGDGLYFASGEEEIQQSLKVIKGGLAVSTREKVVQYSWQNIARQLEETYALLRS
jgi:glycosyltransferase involved in cell wall biosynthesis